MARKIASAPPLHPKLAESPREGVCVISRRCALRRAWVRDRGGWATGSGGWGTDSGAVPAPVGVAGRIHFVAAARLCHAEIKQCQHPVSTCHCMWPAAGAGARRGCLSRCTDRRHPCCLPQVDGSQRPHCLQALLCDGAPGVSQSAKVAARNHTNQCELSRRARVRGRVQGTLERLLLRARARRRPRLTRKPLSLRPTARW